MSPIFDFTEVEIPYLQVEQTIAFFTRWEDIDVLVSRNYTGGNPQDADWQSLSIEDKPKGDINWETIQSEKVSLAKYAGSESFTVAFRYRAGAAGSSVWQIDSFNLGGAGLITKAKASASSSQEAAKPELEELYAASFEKDLGAFTSFVALGEAAWSVNAERSVAQISAFKKGASEAWLVSPEIDLSGVKTAELSGFFTTGFFTQDSDMAILVSEDFDKDPSVATWVELDMDRGQASEGSNWRDWGQKPASLQAFVGKKIYLGFRYLATEDKASTWQIKNLAVRGEK